MTISFIKRVRYILKKDDLKTLKKRLLSIIFNLQFKYVSILFMQNNFIFFYKI